MKSTLPAPIGQSLALPISADSPPPRQTVRSLAVEMEVLAVRTIEAAKGTPNAAVVRRHALRIVEETLALCSTGGPAA